MTVIGLLTRLYFMGKFFCRGLDSTYSINQEQYVLILHYHLLFISLLFHSACVLYYCKCGGVDLMGLKPNPWDPVFLQCFVAVGWVI